MDCRDGPSLEQATAEVTSEAMEKFKYGWYEIYYFPYKQLETYFCLTLHMYYVIKKFNIHIFIKPEIKTS